MPLGIGFWKKFGEILGRRIQASWQQVRWKIDVMCGKRVLKKLRFSEGKTMISNVLGTEVGSSNGPQNQSKNQGSMGRQLGIDCSGFWWTSEDKLGKEILQKSIQTCTEKMMTRNCRLGDRPAHFSRAARCHPTECAGPRGRL